ncbi:cytochrome P450 [Russula emetica]|nr:cytochrome P450 [Russula emetica]
MQLLLINIFDCLAISCFLYLLVVFRDHRRRRGLPYPPSPPPRPIIGNLLDFPKDTPWSAYAEMSKKYAIKDLLEKRGEIYSDRPSLPIAKMTDMDWPLFMTGMTETWREGRKLVDHSLRPGAVITYGQMMQEKTREFLTQLFATPKNFRSHIELPGSLQGKFIMSLTYGYDLKDGDKILEAPVQANELLSPLILPGATLVNHLPILRHIPSWVPYFSYEPVARIVRKLSQRIRNEPFDFVKNALNNGTAVQSLASEHLQELENLVGSEREKQEEIIKVTTGSMYQGEVLYYNCSGTWHLLDLFSAGSGTVQRRAQAELDVVVGRDRLPTFDDRPRLPYIEALCKELMRWQMVTPIGLPHLSSRDDVYRGYFIPKGSIMVANAWAILHDPEIYQEPEEFKPERFLNEDGSVRDDPTLSLVFGIGKRICPGRHFVDATIFIFTSSVLSVYDVTKAKDENGHEIPVNAAVTARRGVVM